MEERNVAPVPAPAVGATKATPPGKHRVSTGPAVGPPRLEDCPLSAETPVISAQWIHRAASGRHARSQEAWPRGARLHTHTADIHPRTCVKHTRILLCTSPELPDPSWHSDRLQSAAGQGMPSSTPQTDRVHSIAMLAHTKGSWEGKCRNASLLCKTAHFESAVFFRTAKLSVSALSAALPPHAPRVLKAKPL